MSFITFCGSPVQVLNIVAYRVIMPPLRQLRHLCLRGNYFDIQARKFFGNLQCLDALESLFISLDDDVNIFLTDESLDMIACASLRAVSLSKRFPGTVLFPPHCRFTMAAVPMGSSLPVDQPLGEVRPLADLFQKCSAFSLVSKSCSWDGRRPLFNARCDQLSRLRIDLPACGSADSWVSLGELHNLEWLHITSESSVYFDLNLWKLKALAVEAAVDLSISISETCLQDLAVALQGVRFRYNYTVRDGEMGQSPEGVKKVLQALKAQGKHQFGWDFTEIGQIEVLWVCGAVVAAVKSPHDLFDACACGACEACLMLAGVLT